MSVDPVSCQEAAMAEKAQTTKPSDKRVQKREPTKPVAQEPVALTQQADLETLQRAVANPRVARPSDILALQRTAGNQAVTRLIQTKLAVGPAGDRYEQEADRVAEQVMTMPAPTSRKPSVQRAAEEEEEVQTKPLAASITPLAQRQSLEEEEVQTQPLQRQAEEEEIQTKPLLQRQAEEEEEVQTKPLAASIMPLAQRQEVPEEEEVQTKPLVQRQEMPEEEVQTQRLQRQAEEEEEEVQTKPLVQRQEATEEEEVQTRPLVQRQGEGGFEAGSDIEQRLAASRGGGSPLPSEVRAYMEPRFEADFGSVRVHTGDEASQLNRALSAQAFTHGQDIYLGEGKYAPGSDAGKRLLAHELTHVVQQTGRVQPRIQRWSIGGWFSKKGHEAITEDSIDQWNKEAVRNRRPDLQISDKDKKQLVKGARWNDLLGHWGVVTMGLALFGSKRSLTHESHEGKLQFLHGMAARETESVWKTRHKIMTWAKFCYLIGTNRMGDVNTKTLGQVQMTPPRTDFVGGGTTIPELFDRWKDKTISWLFSDSDKTDAGKIRMRAIGSMLHMLQDTFCVSHTQRAAEKRAGEETRRIRSFNVYTEQSASIFKGLFSKWQNRHGIADKLKDKQVTKTAGATEAADVGAVVLKHVMQGADWDTVVEPYLLKVFALEAKTLRIEELGTQAPEQPKVTASGRLFRKKWLSDRFKSASSPHWYSRRPLDFKMLVQQLEGYEQLLKEDLNTMTQHQTTEHKRAQLELEKTMVQGIISSATKLKEKHAGSTDKAMQQTRLPAIDELLNELQKDMNEIESDLASMRRTGEQH
jgi:hypothetical protein